MIRRMGVSIAMLTLSFTAEAQQYKQLTDVPTVYIETEGKKDITSKEHYSLCTVTYVDGDSIASYPNTEIRGRGNSSWWNSQKKSFRIKFAEKQKFLGKGFANARSWTLLANHGDKTLIRNALTYDLGQLVGMPFCPAARFIDLYLNGKYQGAYQISDQVQIHKKRIEIDETQGWLLEVANNNSKEDPNFSTSRGIMYNLKRPEGEFLSASTRISIAQFMQRFENALFSNAFYDKQKGYRALVDEDDLVRWYVAAEITGNIDALYSIYLYKDAEEEHLHFGPLWDLDLGYDNSSERSLLQAMEGFLGLKDRPFEQYIQRLWEDLWFANACNDLLNRLVDQGLELYLLNHIDSLRDAVYQSQRENFRVWRVNERVYDWAKHQYYSTYDPYIDDLKDFVRIHIPYLQEAFAEKKLAVGIKGIREEAPQGDDAIYDLNGRRVTNPRRGIYIRNGKKYVIQ